MKFETQNVYLASALRSIGHERMESRVDGSMIIFGFKSEEDTKEDRQKFMEGALNVNCHAFVDALSEYRRQIQKLRTTEKV